jgi:predicted DCC family thiol-disulfide oxidoreductase YuxK
MTTNSPTSTIPLDKPILLFDGVCNFCNSSVQTLISMDKSSHFRLASLQSEVGQTLLKKFNLPTKELNTVVLIDKNKVYLRSDVPLEVMRQLGSAWQIFYIFKIVPRFLRDAVYNFIASNRYRWFGKEEACMIPSAEVRQRFLD